MPQSMKVRRLLDDSNRPVLTFHTGPDDYNLVTTLQQLANLLGEAVHRCVGPRSFGACQPHGLPSATLSAGYYRLLFGVMLDNGEMIWRERTSRIFVEGLDDEDDHSDSPSPSPQPALSV
jgi:hypothetical protein